MKYRLEDIAPIQQGSVPEADKYWLLNLDMVESNTGRIIDYLFCEEKDIGNSTVAFDTKNVLYSKLRPYLNKVALPEMPGYATSEMIPLRPNNHVITREYLTYFLRSQSFVSYINTKTSGAKMPRANISDLKSVIIECPPIESQKRIVEEFDTIASIIDMRTTELHRLDELIKARFVELFGDISSGTYKYETRKLGEVANVGSSHRVFTSEFVETGVPFYRGTEIGELANGQVPSEPYYISEEHYNRISNDDTKPRIGDLLMPSICNKGQVWMVDTDKPFYYKDGRVLCISADRTLFNTKFLQYFMREKTLVEYPKMGSGSTFAEFKIFLLKDMDVIIPPRSIQDCFSDFVNQVDKSKDEVQKALKKTQLLFDSLMQEYFG